MFGIGNRFMNANAHAGLAANGSPRSSRTELTVSGMTCNNCARHVREAIETVRQVADASVELEAGRASVRWKDGPDLPAVLRAVANAGYEAKPITETSTGGKVNRQWSPLSGWRF